MMTFQICIQDNLANFVYAILPALLLISMLVRNMSAMHPTITPYSRIVHVIECLQVKVSGYGNNTQFVHTLIRNAYT